MIEIREATKTEMDGVAQLINQTWPQEQPSPERIAWVCEQPGHTLLVAHASYGIQGFVSGFPTIGDDGSKRWELDLLSVDPIAQGRGIAKQLIRACEPLAQQIGASVIRALVRSDNVRMMAACKACGYDQEPVLKHLLIATATSDQSPRINELPLGLHIVEVTTLTYSGIWLEGVITEAALEYGRQLALPTDVDVVGLLLSAADYELIQMAKDAGYETVSDYYFWLRNV